MTIREPDKDPPQMGGVIRQRIIKPGRVLSEASIPGKTKAVTQLDAALKVVKKIKPMSVSIKKAAEIRRQATVKAKKAVKKVATKIRGTTALAKKKVSKVVPIAKRTIRKKSALTTSTDQKMSIAQSKIFTIKSKAKAKAKLAGENLRAALQSRAVANKSVVMTRLKTKLTALQDKRLATQIPSTQVRLGGNEQSAAVQHNQGVAKLTSSTPTLTAAVKTCGDKATNIATLTGQKGSINTAITATGTSRSGIDSNRTQAGKSIGTNTGKAGDAATKAETARAGSVATSDSIAGKVRERDTAATGISGTNDKIAADRVAAVASGTTASKLDGMRRTTNDTVTSRSSDKSIADTGPQRATGDVDTHTKEETAALATKGAADTALGTVKTTHDANLKKWTSDADGQVEKYRSQREIINAESPAGAIEARKVTEAAIETNTSDITAKNGEVVAARAAESLAQADHTAKVVSVKGRQADLDGLVGGEGALHTARETALSNAEQSRPVHNPADIASKARHEHIEGTDIPAIAEGRRVAAIEAARI